jgi:hypothetical protein
VTGVPNIKELMFQSISKVLQDFAFCFPNESIEDFEVREGYSLAYVSFEGPLFKGTLYQYFPEAFLMELGRSMTGGIQLEGLANKVNLELLNIVVGHFLTDYYGVDSEIKLGIPKPGNVKLINSKEKIFSYEVEGEFSFFLILDEEVSHGIN